MKYNIKNIKAFTLMELVITIVILGILIVLIVGSYETYLKEAKTTEGIMLASSIAKIQTIYQREYGAYLPITNASFNEIPEIEARFNKYFKVFSVHVPGDIDDAIFTVSTESESNIATGNIKVILHVFENKSNKMTVTYTDLSGEQTEVEVK
ncbi:hypothetical protein MASR1M68_13920 [Elusimicrobiota bacterium]